MIRLTKRDALRAIASGRQAVAMRAAAIAIFEAGGRKLLPLSAQQAIRSVVEREATRFTAGVGGFFKEAAHAPVAVLEAPRAATTAVRVAAAPVARTAAQQMLRGIGRAAGAGAVVDGAWGAAEAYVRVKNKTMSPREGVLHVAKEASTGAVATAAGAAAAAALVTVTGGLAVPAVFVVAATTAVAAKIGLSAWLDKREIVARLAAG